MKNALKRFRESNGFTQNYIGKRLDIDKSTVAKWESGTAYPYIVGILEVRREYYGCGKNHVHPSQYHGASNGENS